MLTVGFSAQRQSLRAPNNAASRGCALASPAARRASTRKAQALPDGGEDISDALKADLERFKAKASTSAPASSKVSASEAESKGGLKETLDKVLIADFFVVLAVLGWLAAGVAQSALSGGTSTQLLDAWYPLWPLLWQPAIGLLMAGALVSGGLNWLEEQKAKSK